MAGEGHIDRALRQGVRHLLAPLHGADGAAGEIVLPADVEQVLRPVQPVHIEVEQRGRALIFVDDGEGGAGDPAPASQATGKATGKGGLAHAQTAPVGHHGAGRESGGQPFTKGLRLRLAVGNILHEAALLSSDISKSDSVYHILNSL